MKSKNICSVIVLFFLITLLFTSGQGIVSADMEEPSPDGIVGELTQPIRYVVADENEAMQGIQFPAEPGLLSRAGGATFNITYVPNGGTDKWSQACVTFPEEAKTAFNYAASIWAAKISSPVPITIRACWASLGDPSILGYSGGGTLHYNFPGAPLSDTIYTASLANSLYGSDMSTNEDMHITYNTNFNWYYGLDGNPGSGKYDLVTVAAHEIAHGLNFSGSASMSGAIGDLGYIVGEERFFNVYDTFMRDWMGDLLMTDYTIPSTLLGDALTSDNLWFHGPNAMAVDGDRVQMYAPTTWADGSSYSHLNYGTYAGTINSMMVYAVAPNSSQHNTGPITDALLKDLGWASGESYYAYLPFVSNDSGVVIPPDTIVNGDFESGHVEWAEYSEHGWDIIDQVDLPPHSGTWLAWLGGDNEDSSWVSQSVFIPVGRSILHFWYWIDSDDGCGSFFDYFYIDIAGDRQVLWDICFGNNTGGWMESTLNLTPWAGSAVSVRFGVDTDVSNISHMFLDDVSLEATTRTAAPVFIDGVNSEAVRLRQ